MYTRKLEKDIRCPLEYALDVFGGKWKSRIICLLAQEQTVRYSELRKKLCDITDTMLVNSLKELQRDGMVMRVQYNEIPPKVEYSLTPKDYSVIPILIRISEWGRENEEKGMHGVCSECPGDYIRR